MRLAYSPLGVHYPPEKFVRTPLKVIGRLVEHINTREQYEANRDSITQAQMAHLLMMLGHAYSGSKKSPPRVQPSSFLPYPEFRGAEQEDKGPDKATQFVLSEVGRQGRIPAYVLVALMTRAD